MTTITETQVVRACQTLFGNDIDISKHFLYYSIQPSGVKSAYRKKAKESHPDLFASDPVHIQQKQTAIFREILQAYDLLNLFFKQREQGAWKSEKAARPWEKKTEPARNDRTSEHSREKGSHYYRGTVPHRTLQIGQYLYYRGKITFETLIKALVWQRKQRPSIGDIAVQWGLLQPANVGKIFNVCGKPRLFGEKAVELGLLTVFQVNTILLYQRSRQDRLGNYFMENKILSQEELELLALDLKKHNAAILAAATNRRRKEAAYA